ncbi:hypothetical protein PIECOFPK_01307 [Mycovorax composti]|jgi:hypothetical protein|uniref:ABC transporter permease n=2 Tax=Chitinophagaceae TaxID=563835 RepID=A0ABZ2EJJ1_9BACT
MKKAWWKILCVILLVYAIVGGMLVKIPNLPVLGETIRNLFYHVGMWAAMFVLFTCSLVHSIRYLRNSNLKNDIAASQYASVGILFGILGYATGAVWASYTWADPNNPAFDSFSAVAREPKLIGTAIALLIYFAYFILRSSIQDIDQKAKISAVYNIFAFAMLFPTIMIVPRLLPSLHPGQEGNPALNFKDASPELRMIEYPAFIGWTLLGVWIATLKIRLHYIREKHLLK